jgi:protein-tyrosine phosphatase
MSTSVLFVCLGNICRSPLAEGIFRHLVREREVEHLFRIDSAGTSGYHAGSPPDSRSVVTARARGVVVEGRSRQIVEEDLYAYDWVIVMDEENLHAVRRLAEGASGRARIHLLREWDPDAQGADVPDPYYGGPRGFEDVHDIVARSCERLLDGLLDEVAGA